MSYKRYVRFCSIDGIDRADLPLAAEVWLDDVSRSTWADRSVVKLATLMTRYMREADPDMLAWGALERRTGLDRKQAADTLRIMEMFGAVECYDTDGDALRAGLNLSYLQRLAVLEKRARFKEMRPGSQIADLPWRRTEEDIWKPRKIDIAEVADVPANDRAVEEVS